MRGKNILSSVATAFWLLSFTPALTRADVVYNTDTGTQFIDQQTGNAFYYIGDTATIAPTAQALTTIVIPFGTSYYSGIGANGTAFTYTPDISLDLYPTEADALTGANKLGSAVENAVTLTNDGVLPAGSDYNYEDETQLTFDFTSQNITLPTSFVFAYHDAGSLDSTGSVNGENGLSVGVTAAPATTGISLQNYFQTYPNAAPSGTDPSIIWPGPYDSTAGLNVEAEINTVPEPTTLSLLGIGSLALLRRKRRATI